MNSPTNEKLLSNLKDYPAHLSLLLKSKRKEILNATEENIFDIKPTIIVYKEQNLDIEQFYNLNLGGDIDFLLKNAIENLNELHRAVVKSLFDVTPDAITKRLQKKFGKENTDPLETNFPDYQKWSKRP